MIFLLLVLSLLSLFVSLCCSSVERPFVHIEWNRSMSILLPTPTEPWMYIPLDCFSLGNIEVEMKECAVANAILEILLLSTDDGSNDNVESILDVDAPL